MSIACLTSLLFGSSRLRDTRRWHLCHEVAARISLVQRCSNSFAFGEIIQVAMGGSIQLRAMVLSSRTPAARTCLSIFPQSRKQGTVASQKAYASATNWC